MKPSSDYFIISSRIIKEKSCRNSSRDLFFGILPSTSPGITLGIIKEKPLTSLSDLKFCFSLFTYYFLILFRFYCFFFFWFLFDLCFSGMKYPKSLSALIIYVTTTVSVSPRCSSYESNPERHVCGIRSVKLRYRSN